MLNFFIMEKFLEMVEPTAQEDEVEMDPEKLNLFNSRSKFGDFAKISSSDFQSPSFDKKSSLLKKYYVEMLPKYTEGISKLFWLCFE